MKTYFVIKKFIINRKAIGQRVTIDYFDNNIHFETIFPKNGKIAKIIKIKRQKSFVIELDAPFKYKKKVYNVIVVKERHAGRYIGDKEEVHVHVLLPKRELNMNKFHFTDFDHVVWAIIKPEIINL